MKKKVSLKKLNKYYFDHRLLQLLGLNFNERYTIRTIMYSLYDNINKLETDPEFSKLRDDIKYKETARNAIRRYIVYNNYNKYIILNTNKYKTIDEISILI